MLNVQWYQSGGGYFRSHGKIGVCFKFECRSRRTDLSLDRYLVHTFSTLSSCVPLAVLQRTKHSSAHRFLTCHHAMFEYAIGQLHHGNTDATQVDWEWLERLRAQRASAIGRSIRGSYGAKIDRPHLSPQRKKTELE